MNSGALSCIVVENDNFYSPLAREHHLTTIASLDYAHLHCIAY